MRVEQVYNLLNVSTSEILGESVVVSEDLSNVVDIGEAIFNANAIDSYVRSLVNHIGKVIFVDRPYTGSLPSVLMDSWEFGSVLEKITAELPEAEENESWELQHGASYDTNIFYQPKVEAKFFNKMITFEIPMSFTERQVKQSFSNASQLNAFMSMLYNAVDKSMTVKIDSLVMKTICNMIGETVLDDFTGGVYNNDSGVKAVNLLYLYNNKFNTSLTAEESITNPEFIRYASYMMGMYSDRLGKISKLFNIGKKDRFTPSDKLHFVLLSDFYNASLSYLQSDTFNEKYTALPNAEIVPYWQGSGLEYSFDDISKIDITTASGTPFTLSGILGVMFDRDSLGVTNLDKRTTSSYNPKGEFFTNWYKFDAGYFNDTNENFVVFFVA